MANTIMANPVLAVVTDIRGFTEFTSTIDAVNQSAQFPASRRPTLLRDYDGLVVLTQRTAIQTILGPLARELSNPNSDLAKAWARHQGNNQPLPCALKSTGDGFLVAIELVHNGVVVGPELQSELANALTLGVTELVRQSKPGGTFRTTIEGFFEIWQHYLAMPLQGETFRVAGAIALGTGQVSDEDVPREFATHAHLTSTVPEALSALVLKSDAYGHGVNLAFRLCDRAGRGDPTAPEKETPYVLLDRRAGQLLVVPDRNKEKPTLEWARNKNGDLEPQQPYAMRPFGDFCVCRFGFCKPLKGIDEMWCYGLEEPKALLSGGRSSRRKGGLVNRRT